MGKLIKLAVLAGAIGWLASIGALDPRLWPDLIKRERERLGDQLREALEAGKRAAARAEQEFQEQLDASGSGAER